MSKCLAGLRITAAILFFASNAQAQEQSPVLPFDYKGKVLNYLEGKLLDPSSAQVKEQRGIRWGTYKNGPFAPNLSGWISCYSINGKNAYGGYTGYRRWLFVLNGAGEVLSATREDEQYLKGIGRPGTLDLECAKSADTN